MTSDSASELALTSEQAAVVAHDGGPALVFAVAGAGKTTAMVHRIERLVREHVFAPQKILATSFGKATVEELKTRLRHWEHCAAVRPMTLHGIGWRVMKQLQKQSLLPARFQLPGGEENSHALFYQTLRMARQQRSEFGDLDSLDADDFLDWVGSCKARLQYADLEEARLPAAGLEIASQAKAPKGLPDYLPLYRLYERLRLQSGVLTFDDLLTGCWEAFLRHPQVLQNWRRQFDCLLVDEFQDINLVQSEMLDLLSREHSNYMAIGDDDQTIYQWRGASPEFILGFIDRYASKHYLLTDNFRSGAGPLALANAVIQQNEQRAPKRLHLTKGFGEETLFQVCQDGPAQAQAVVDTIESRLAQGIQPAEIAVLVRTYAQTPFIERMLIDKGLPYHLPDGRLFYQRIEIRDLLSYVALARLDAEVSQSKSWSDEAFESFNRHWNRIRNRPTRYFSNQLSQDVIKILQRDGVSLSEAMSSFALLCEEYLSERLRKFAEMLTWLSRAWENGSSAYQALSWLEQRLDWCHWLESSSAVAEEGRERAENVRAFLAFSQDLGTLAELRDELQRLARQQRENLAQGRSAAVMLTSIHRAKGLEWDTVLIPGCNDGVYPPERENDLESERRLLYVALTRPKRRLELFYTRSAPISPFLRVADGEGVLQKVAKLRHLLNLPDSEWDWSRCRELFQLLPPLKLGRYFRQWHSFSLPVQRLIQGALSHFQTHELWHKVRLDPMLHGVWCASETARAVRLDPSELVALEAVFCPPEGQLKPGQVRHARYGLGTIVKEVAGRDRDMLLVNFAGKGKMQLPIHDPELSR